MCSAEAPSPGLLMELGKYLFASAPYPDKDENNGVFTISNS
jgi:hypothetical protein